MFLCRSIGQQFAPYSGGSSVCLWGFSHWLYLRGQHGEGREKVGTHPGMHFNDHCCFPLKRVFFLLTCGFLAFLISQLKQPYPLPLQSSGRSNFVYIRLVFVSTNVSEALFDSVVLNLKKCHIDEYCLVVEGGICAGL